jgi:hypothetical protein
MAKTQVGTPSEVDAKKRNVELKNLMKAQADGIIPAGNIEVGHGFLVKVKNESGEWIRDVFFIVNRANTAICRNWPQVATPGHKAPVEVEMAPNTSESRFFEVVR